MDVKGRISRRCYSVTIDRFQRSFFCTKKAPVLLIFSGSMGLAGHRVSRRTWKNTRAALSLLVKTVEPLTTSSTARRSRCLLSAGWNVTSRPLSKSSVMCVKRIAIAMSSALSTPFAFNSLTNVSNALSSSRLSAFVRCVVTK